MSRTTADDQLKFLLSCVKHANAGKIDFVPVAKECGIISKGAAAKRFERLMKANGIHPGSAENQNAASPREKSKAAIAKSAAAKRRKIEGEEFDSRAEDDADSTAIIPKREPLPEPPIKSEPRATYFGPTNPSILQPGFPPYGMSPVHISRAQPMHASNYHLNGYQSPLVPQRVYYPTNQPGLGNLFDGQKENLYHSIKVENPSENERAIYRHHISPSRIDPTSGGCKQETETVEVKAEPAWEHLPSSSLRANTDIPRASVKLEPILSGSYENLKPQSLPPAPQEVVLAPTSGKDRSEHQTESPKLLRKSRLSLSLPSPSARAQMQTKSESDTITGRSINDCIVIAD